MSYLIDSGFLYASINSKEKNHLPVLKIITSLNGAVHLPTVITTEVAYLIRRDLSTHESASFLDFLAKSPFIITEPIAADFARAAEIIRQYNDSHIDFVDAIIFAMAERLRITKILTIDQRHFRMFRPKHCPAFELYP